MHISEPISPEPMVERLTTLPSAQTLELNGYSAPVALYLEQLDERVMAQARAFDPDIIPYVEYALRSSGKRIRPTLALLCGQATGGVTDLHLDLAVAVELIHLASLVHDDIIDGAEQRRGKATASARWGAEISVLLGDCLFAHALKLCSNLTAEMSRTISDAVCEVCSGEIMQTQRRFDLTLDLPDYHKIIGMKTGALFRIPCDLGAWLNNAEPAIRAALKNYGANLGVAYQIYDDCLDLFGEEAAAGKTLGTDLERGKITLPVLYLLEQVKGREHEIISGYILQGNESNRAELVRLMRERGTLEKSVQTLRGHLTTCQDDLQALLPSPSRNSLLEIPLAIDRHVSHFLI